MRSRHTLCGYRVDSLSADGSRHAQLPILESNRGRLGSDPPLVVSSTGRRVITPPGDTMGNGEIRVAGSAGVVYVAPVLVAHYVEVHNYCPPEEFIVAVISADGIASA